MPVRSFRFCRHVVVDGRSWMYSGKVKNSKLYDEQSPPKENNSTHETPTGATES